MQQRFFLFTSLFFSALFLGRWGATQKKPPTNPRSTATRFRMGLFQDPEPSDKGRHGRFEVVHKGMGKPGKSYFKSHKKGEVAEYHLFIPEGMKPNRRYPLLIAFHGGKDGASGRGTCGSMARVSTRKNPVIVLAPNMYTYDSYHEILKRRDLPIDPKRILVMGHSSGGMGVRQGFLEWMESKGSFLPIAYVSVSTTASLGRTTYPPTPYYVVAGEKETPEFVKNKILKNRRSVCRRHALVMQAVFKDCHYIEVPGTGHSGGTPKHIALLRNLLALSRPLRLGLKLKRGHPSLAAFQDSIESGDWKAIRRQIRALDQNPPSKAKLSYATLRRKVMGTLAKLVAREAKAIQNLGPKSGTLEVQRALKVFDQLQEIQKLFADTKKAKTIRIAMKKIDKNPWWKKELEARAAFYALMEERPSKAWKAKLIALRAKYPGTEFGARRVGEKLLALEL
ncbi:MAG TPA: hypothetical protein ENK02_10150 [Planctomycetes bacterium]|nr:hypothetical protein [Planctomycetota bacterium]